MCQNGYFLYLVFKRFKISRIIVPSVYLVHLDLESCIALLIKLILSHCSFLNDINVTGEIEKHEDILTVQLGARAKKTGLEI